MEKYTRFFKNNYQKLKVVRYTIFLILLTSKLFAQNPISIGFSSVDEYIRILQLQGKLDADESLMNRPYYSTNAQNWNDLINTVEPKLQYKAPSLQFSTLTIKALPVNLVQKVNTTRAFGWNDQALGYSKGYQGQISSGVYAKWGILHVQLQPELAHYANGNFDKKTKLLPGQSFIGIQTRGLGVSLSNENMWWGPGRYGSLLMSNNASGFEHLKLNTIHPINIGVGKIEFTLILGRLNRDSAQGFENFNLLKRGFSSTQPNSRQINGVNIVFQPKFLKNVFIGLNRVFQNYEANNQNGKSFLTQYLPVLNGLYKNNYADDTLSKDQLLSINTRWLFPQNHAEIYFEYGFNDAKQNVRDLLVDMSHSSAYTFGIRKMHFINEHRTIDFGFEATKMSQTPSYIQRIAGNWYEHGQVLEGYTQNNQIMGVGAGHGNDLQTFTLALNEGFNRIGLKFQHIANNPYLVTEQNAVKLRNTKWDDYVFGTQLGHRYKNLIFSANVEWINAKNYNWINGNNKGNLMLLLNTVYLW